MLSFTKQFVLRPLEWLGRYELPTLLCVGVVAAGLWGFIELADEVFEQETQSFDRAVLLSMRSADDLSDPIGPRWVEELGRDFTALGGVGVLTFLTLAVAGFLLLEGKGKAMVFVLAAVAGALVVSFSLKAGFDRARPDLVPHGSHVYTQSFPSGHSMLSAATYLTLGALLARVHSRRSVKAYVLILAVLLSLAVGVSRVYLGVHWPTDVLAGWTLGAVWAAACWIVARWLQRRGMVEKEAST